MSEEFGPDFFTVTDEEGNEFELELVDSLEHEGVLYHAFFPAVEEGEDGEPVEIDADDDEQGLIILKVIREGDEELLSTLDSDEELEAVYQLFMDRLFEDEDEE